MELFATRPQVGAGNLSFFLNPPGGGVQPLNRNCPPSVPNQGYREAFLGLSRELGHGAMRECAYLPDTEARTTPNARWGTGNRGLSADSSGPTVKDCLVRSAVTASSEVASLLQLFPDSVRGGHDADLGAALLRFQECHEPLRESFNVADFAFPGYECMPALASKRSNRASIPVNIPDCAACARIPRWWQELPDLELAPVHVPEAAVHEDHFATPREHKIRPTR